MLVVVSPAKNLDFESEIPVSQFTQPAMLEDTERLKFAAPYRLLTYHR